MSQRWISRAPSAAWSGAARPRGGPERSPALVERPIVIPFLPSEWEFLSISTSASAACDHGRPSGQLGGGGLGANCMIGFGFHPCEHSARLVLHACGYLVLCFPTQSFRGVVLSLTTPVHVRTGRIPEWYSLNTGNLPFKTTLFFQLR